MSFIIEISFLQSILPEYLVNFSVLVSVLVYVLLSVLVWPLCFLSSIINSVFDFRQKIIFILKITFDWECREVLRCYCSTKPLTPEDFLNLTFPHSPLIYKKMFYGQTVARTTLSFSQRHWSFFYCRPLLPSHLIANGHTDDFQAPSYHYFIVNCTKN